MNKQKVLMYYLKKLIKKTKTELFEIAKVKHFCLLAGMKISGLLIHREMRKCKQFESDITNTSLAERTISDDKLYSVLRFNQNPDYYNEYWLLDIIYHTLPCVILISRYTKPCKLGRQ